MLSRNCSRVLLLQCRSGSDSTANNPSLSHSSDVFCARNRLFHATGKLLSSMDFLFVIESAVRLLRSQTMSKKLLSLFFIFLVVATYLALYRPSNYFRNALDLNNDNKLSRYEWQIIRPDTNLSSATGWARIFVNGDCNNNGLLTWREYYNVRNKAGELCNEVPYLKNLYRQHPTNIDSTIGSFPFIFTEDQLSIIRNSSLETNEKFAELINLHLRSNAEQMIINEYQNRISIECEERVHERYFDRWMAISSDVYKLQFCTIINKNTDIAISSAAFLLTEQENLILRESVHIKALPISSGSHIRIVILYRTESTPIDIQIQNVYQPKSVASFRLM